VCIEHIAYLLTSRTPLRSRFHWREQNVNKLENVNREEANVFAMSSAPKFLENSERFKIDKDGFDDNSGAGRR